MDGFYMNLDTAMEFYKRCMEQEAKTEVQKVAILNELKKELRTISLNEKDIKRTLRGKKILRIKGDKSV